MVKNNWQKNINSKKVFIIAEAGINHNGSIRIAKKMIEIAEEAGVDAVKFQTFKAKKLTCEFTPKAEYQKNSTDKTKTQFEMLKKLELGIREHKDLIAYCRKRRIMFLSSPFDLDSIGLLNRLGLEVFKIPSGEITNPPFLKKVGRLNKKIILSTGMSDLKEIGTALKILIDSGTPKENITVLHCTTEYPAPIDEVNLLAMLTIKNTFNINVGYSDHTLGIEVSIAAVALGASVIEKHFTLSRNMDGPDHKSSSEPQELKEMIKAIRNIEKALGNGIKSASPSELKNSALVRKSIVTERAINKGEIFTERNLSVKRPATGISPMLWDDIIGKRAKGDFKKGELIEI